MSESYQKQNWAFRHSLWPGMRCSSASPLACRVLSYLCYKPRGATSWATVDMLKLAQDESLAFCSSDFSHKLWKCVHRISKRRCADSGWPYLKTFLPSTYTLFTDCNRHKIHLFKIVYLKNSSFIELNAFTMSILMHRFRGHLKKLGAWKYEEVTDENMAWWIVEEFAMHGKASKDLSVEPLQSCAT